MRRLAPLLAIFLAACATVATLQLDDRFGSPDPARFDGPSRVVAGAPDYWHEVRPILDRRCVSCHACYDAPCQLNLTSYAGLTRGANNTQVYALRLLAETPTRLGIDARTNADWRRLGFFPVLNERQPSPEANRVAGVMHRLLTMKQLAPGPDHGRGSDADLDFSLDRAQICTPAEGLDDYARAHPTRGMPFGLPALSKGEHKTLTRWLEAGAPYMPPPPLPESVERQIDDWERFFNGDDAKSRLSARYIFEHWFAGHLWFAEQPGLYFELVRSRTPPGQPIDRIATRRPFDDPGVARVWYRLHRAETTIVAKTHMPLLLDAGRLEKLRRWFLRPDYAVKALPGYDPDVASNPFVTFRDLPLNARYRLMIEDADFTLAGFMKGPVCRGQVALNSINDHFWVFFVAPNEKDALFMQQLIDGAAPILRLPAERDNAAGLLAWNTYARLEKQYLQTKSAVVQRLGKAGVRPTLADIWDGDGTNPNAALTVFRHFDSASVERGLLGDRPQTVFVMGYPLLERMHYLLSAGFDVFGNVGHQLATRLYMDFLRMESELNFIALLPLKDRQPVLDRWYRGRSAPHNRFFADATAHFPEETGIRYRTEDSLTELYERLRQRVAPVRDSTSDLASAGLDGADVATLRQLSGLTGIAASIMPEASLLRVSAGDAKPAVISLIRDSAHTNVAHMFDEEDRRVPEEDQLWAFNGVLTAYPNAIFSVDRKHLASFANAIRELRTPSDLDALADRFGVRRTDRQFWAVSDAIHERWRTERPIDFGVLDYSRLER
jgi:hypothetical protein